jgi:hypothetical protein
VLCPLWRDSESSPSHSVSNHPWKFSIYSSVDPFIALHSHKTKDFLRFFTMSSHMIDLHHFVISSWVEVLHVSKFRPDKGELKEPLLAFNNTNIFGYMEINIPDQFSQHSSLVETPLEDDLPFTLTTFSFTTSENDYLDKSKRSVLAESSSFRAHPVNRLTHRRTFGRLQDMLVRMHS